MPMHKLIAHAAGGIIQRLNCGPAMMRSRPSHRSNIFASPARFRIVLVVLVTASLYEAPAYLSRRGDVETGQGGGGKAAGAARSGEDPRWPRGCRARRQG